MISMMIRANPHWPTRRSPDARSLRSRATSERAGVPSSVWEESQALTEMDPNMSISHQHTRTFRRYVCIVMYGVILDICIYTVYI